MSVSLSLPATGNGKKKILGRKRKELGSALKKNACDLHSFIMTPLKCTAQSLKSFSLSNGKKSQLIYICSVLFLFSFYFSIPAYL